MVSFSAGDTGSDDGSGGVGGDGFVGTQGLRDTKVLRRWRIIKVSHDTYDTNVWGDCQWLKVQNHRRLTDGQYTTESRWQWIQVDELLKWFRHKSRHGVLCFATTARYKAKDKQLPQISNFCGDLDADNDDDFQRPCTLECSRLRLYVRLRLPTV